MQLKGNSHRTSGVMIKQTCMDIWKGYKTPFHGLGNICQVWEETHASSGKCEIFTAVGASQLQFVKQGVVICRTVL